MRGLFLSSVVMLFVSGVVAVTEQPACPAPQLDVAPLPERKPPTPRQDTAKVDVLEARLADAIRRANNQERTIFRLGVLVEDLLGRMEKLEEASRVRNAPAGVRFIPEHDARDGSVMPGRFELIVPHPDQPRTRMRWIPPRQNCDEDDYTPGRWEPMKK